MPARTGVCYFTVLQHFCKIADETLGLRPAEARIGDGLSVYSAVYALIAVLDIAFHEKTFNNGIEILILHVVENFLGYSYLLEGVFAAVGVIGVYYYCGICKVLFEVLLVKPYDVLVVIIRNVITFRIITTRTS